MRENRLYGSEGGGTELNQSPLPLSVRTVGITLRVMVGRINGWRASLTGNTDSAVPTVVRTCRDQLR